METSLPTAIKSRCPKGTRRNKKTGKCEKIANAVGANVVGANAVGANAVGANAVGANVDAKVKSPVTTMKTNKQTGEKTKVKLVFAPAEPLIEEPPVEEPLADQLLIDTKLNALKDKIELKEREEFSKSITSLPYLYPNLNDPNFNINIAQRKEFYDTQYDGEVKDVEAEADIMCNADFELAPHQLFVRNFLSFQTPYNSLLLYHGLGSGKTCSAISIAEEMRDYLIQMNISNRIIIVASPNVQENFKLQLFDERKLQLIDGLWNIRSCTGNKFLKEINPMNMKGLQRDTIIAQVKRIINTYYVFLGYTEFANYIKKKSIISADITDSKKRAALIRNKLRQNFSNRLIIIDEVHNIRIADDNTEKKKVAQELFKLVKYADNMRLLFLSATPMYNSYKEIVWLVNIMNLNDRRSTIEIKDVFNSDGSFKTSPDGEEIGKDLLERKATGYISYVRGENPYTFPYKIWPEEFAPEHTFKTHPPPSMQLNGKPLDQNIEFLSLYLVEAGEYQVKGYEYILNQVKMKQETKGSTVFEELGAFGYTVLQKPIEALNMIYPEDRLLTASADASSNIDTAELVGSGGLNRIMSSVVTVSPPARYDFEYKNIDAYGRIFSPNEIGKYSGKIKTICDRILNSTGVILVYSQYIDGGILPVALALEELGFTRAGTVRSLFKVAPTEKIDAITLISKQAQALAVAGPQAQALAGKKGTSAAGKFNPAKYVMITGDKGLSPDNVKDIQMLTDLGNKDGTQVKVVLISLAGSEGLDLKFIRQVHILDPWYNMNRIEQIIGRAVRTCSHKDLPFVKRNVELYLYGTLLPNAREEAADLYVYRLAELKAIQIGNVSRVIKEIAVDCILNYQQGNFSVENMHQTVKLQLSSGGTLEYQIGDKPYSAICDYMQKCNYTCKPSLNEIESDINSDTYGESFIMMNNDKIVYKIKQLMKDRFFYRKPLLVKMINAVKEYPLMQINAALNQLVEDKNEYITDKYGRLGNLINIADLYLFQPLELTNKHVGLLERSMPIEFKHDDISIDLNKTAIDILDKPDILDKSDKPDKQKKGKKVAEEMATAAAAAPAVAPAPVKNKVTLLLERMYENYTLTTTLNKPKRGEDNWYKFCSVVISEMVEIGVDKDILLEAVIGHLCDELSFEDKLNLLNYFLQPRASSTEFENKINQYLFKDLMKNKGVTGLYIQNKGEEQLFISSVAAAAGADKKFILAEAEDIHDLEDQTDALKNQFLPPNEKLSNVVGFMMNFKKDENNIVFKIKAFKINGVVKKRNKGARCYGKSVEMMTEILGQENMQLYLALIQDKYKDIIEEKKANRELNHVIKDTPDELEAINHVHACVIQEMFLRVYNIQKRDGKRWFLTPEEALLVDLENTTF